MKTLRQQQQTSKNSETKTVIVTESSQCQDKPGKTKKVLRQQKVILQKRASSIILMRSKQKLKDLNKAHV